MGKFLTAFEVSESPGGLEDKLDLALDVIRDYEARESEPLLSHTFLEDNRLSYQALGVFAYLLALDQGWINGEANIGDPEEPKMIEEVLCGAHSGESKAVFDALLALQNYGYISKKEKS
jgi:hypothetical protein